MAYHSSSTYHRTGAADDNVNITANPGYILGLIACNEGAAIATITVHDSLNAATDPRPLLTLHVGPGIPIIVDRPRDRGIEFTHGLTCKFTTADLSIHLTTLEDEVL